MDIQLAQQFADILQSKVEEYFKKTYPDGYATGVFKPDYQVHVKPGKNYIRIDVGHSGKFMSDQNDGLYFIKGYGVIDKKKYFGKLENLIKHSDKWWYDGYSISPVGRHGKFGYAGKITEGNGHEIALQWKGLKGSDAKIGRFIVSPKTYRDLDDLLGHEISIDLYDDEVSGKQLSFSDVINAIKKTKYGKIAFKKKESIAKIKQIIREEIVSVLNGEKIMEMAKLSAKHRQEIGRVSKSKDIPEGDWIIWEKITYAFMSDGVVLQKRDVIFKPDKYNKEGRRHTWGWKQHAKIKSGLTPQEAFERFAKEMEKKGFVKESINEEPIYGTTGPLPLPIGSTKPVIKPNDNNKKKLLVLKLKKIIRDEVRKALLFDTDRTGEIKTRTSELKEIIREEIKKIQESLRSDIENTTQFEIDYDDKPDKNKLDRKIKELARKIGFQVDDTFIEKGPYGYTYYIDVFAEKNKFDKIEKALDSFALSTGGNI